MTKKVLVIKDEDKDKPEVVVELYNKFSGREKRAEFLLERGGNSLERCRWKRDVKEAKENLAQLVEQVPDVEGMVIANRQERGF